MELFVNYEESGIFKSNRSPSLPRSNLCVRSIWDLQVRPEIRCPFSHTTLLTIMLMETFFFFRKNFSIFCLTERKFACNLNFFLRDNPRSKNVLRFLSRFSSIHEIFLFISYGEFYIVFTELSLKRVRYIKQLIHLHFRQAMKQKTFYRVRWRKLCKIINV